MLRARAWWALSLLCACAAEGGAGDPSGTEETGDTGEEYAPPDPVEPSNLCETAPEVGAGRFEGELAELAEELGGPCGGGGPDAFLRVRLPRRADLRVAAEAEGFVPKVGVLPSSCVPDRELACSEDGSPVTITDLPAGSEVLVVVGAAVPGDLPAANAGSLAFAVDVGPTWVLGLDEPCFPPELGRCAHGTTCAPDPETIPEEGEEGEPSGYRCRVLPGDHCATAVLLDVALAVGESTQVEVALAPELTDAHAQSCVGEGRVDHVLQLRFDPAMATLEPGAELQVASVTPDVGLALRAPGCTVDAELDCAEPSSMAGESTVTFPVVAQAATDGQSVFLFVEAPSAEDPLSTVELDLSVVDG